MRCHFARLKGLALALAIGVAPAFGAHCAAVAARRADRPAETDRELGRITAAVQAALTAPPPRGYAPVPPGVRVLSITRGPDAQIVMDFSRHLLSAGTGRPLEDALHQIFFAASAARTPAAGRVDDYKVLVDGTEIERYLP